MTKSQRARLRSIILAFCFAASMGIATGQSVPLVTFPFSLSGVGVGPQIPLSGQSSCAVVLSNAGSGLTLIPQASSDQGATWVTASTIGGGSISAIGSYVGAIGGAGLTNFRFIVSALSSGTVSGQETCSGAIGPAATGGTNTVIQPTASLLNATVVGAGAAGAPSGGVVSIQGVSGGTGVPVTGAITANGQYNTVLPTLTTGTSGPLQTDANGRLLVSPLATPPALAAVATSVAAAATSTLLLGAGTATNGVSFCNNSTSVAYLSMTSPATAAAYFLELPAVGSVSTCAVQMGPNFYRGNWYGLWTSTNGTMTVNYW